MPDIFAGITPKDIPFVRGIDWMIDAYKNKDKYSNEEPKESQSISNFLGSPATWAGEAIAKKQSISQTPFELLASPFSGAVDVLFSGPIANKQKYEDAQRAKDTIRIRDTEGNPVQMADGSPASPTTKTSTRTPLSRDFMTDAGLATTPLYYTQNQFDAALEKAWSDYNKGGKWDNLAEFLGLASPKEIAKLMASNDALKFGQWNSWGEDMGWTDSFDPSAITEKDLIDLVNMQRQQYGDFDITNQDFVKDLIGGSYYMAPEVGKLLTMLGEGYSPRISNPDLSDEDRSAAFSELVDETAKKLGIDASTAEGYNAVLDALSKSATGANTAALLSSLSMGGQKAYDALSPYYDLSYDYVGDDIRPTSTYYGDWMPYYYTEEELYPSWLGQWIQEGKAK